MSEPSVMSCTIGNCGRLAEPMLCRPHELKLGQWIADLELLYTRLDPVPSMATDWGDVSHHPLASQRSPARLAVVVLRDPHRGTGRIGAEDHDEWGLDDTPSALNTLWSWASVIREERSIEPPATEATVSSERNLISVHLEWAVQQPWADEMFSDIRKLWGSLKAAQPEGVASKKRPVGKCPTLIEDHECGGDLWADERAGDVTCRSCGRIFLPEELRHLGDVLIRQGYVEVFRAEWYTGVPAGTIRRWVSEKRCTGKKDGKKLMVQISEIEDIRDRKRTRSAVAS